METQGVDAQKKKMGSRGWIQEGPSSTKARQAWWKYFFELQ